MREKKAPKERTTRLDRKIARKARKYQKRAELHAAQRTPVSGGRLLMVGLAVVVLAAGAWWVNSLFQNAKPNPAPIATHSATPSATPEPTPGETPGEGGTATLDREDPEAVVQTWAEAYLQREEPFDTSWMDVLYEFTSAPVVSQLSLQAFGPEQILDGKAPTTLGTVEITEPAPDAEKNTPVRWSRTVTTHVTGADGSVSVIAFGIVMIHTREGWEITSVEEISLTVTP
ncbi:MAG: hypothetical protein JF592_18440 [Microbacterium sp.]|uniref:hypothetical protein n=1 Tax=Microbacterium sp. TaxID=51671 RepID=UPI001D4643F5|nr:hypothetical protein [Microbacterium sp.]MBW8764528.1 hypothetical protein [Microbacterium sp.]